MLGGGTHSGGSVSRPRLFLKGPLMRGRFFSGMAVVAAVVTLGLVVPSPAAAVSAIDPVDPFPNLPSTANRAFTAAGGIGDNTLSWAMQWALAQKHAEKQAIAEGRTIKPVTPITPAKAPVRGISGHVYLDLALMGYAVTGAGVRVWGSMPGNEVLPSVCGSGIEGIAAVIYPDLMPDCSVPPAQPNQDYADMPAGLHTSTWRGATLSTWVEPVKNPQGVVIQYARCYSVDQMPQGSRFVADKVDRAWIDPVTGFQVMPKLPGANYFMTVGGNSNSDPNRCGGWRFFMATNSAAEAQLYSSSGMVFGLAASATSTAVHPTQQLAGVTPPVAMTPDPLREAKCTLTWSDGSVTEGFIGQYRESEGFPMGAVTAACEDASGEKVAQGLLPETITLDSTDMQTGARTEIAKQTVPPFSESEKVGLTPGDNTGLRLLKVVNGVTQSCMTWEASCVGWWPATASGTVADTSEGTYRCEFGGRAVDLVECGVYRQTFDTRTNTPTVTDPGTGNQVDWSSTTNPANSTSPGVNPSPGEKCITEWGAAPDPIQWVLHPLKCAAMWAFAPRPAEVQKTQTRVDAAWRGSTPGQLATTLLAVQPLLANLSDGGCGGLIVPYPHVRSDGGFQISNAPLLPACSGDFFAPWAPVFKFFIGASLGIGGFFAVKRLLDKFVGM